MKAERLKMSKHGDRSKVSHEAWEKAEFISNGSFEEELMWLLGLNFGSPSPVFRNAAPKAISLHHFERTVG